MMSSRRTRATGWISIAGVSLLLTLGARTPVVFGQEHPKEAEHPEKKEHPEAGKKIAVTVADLAEAITAFVQKDTALKGGYFLVYDAEDKAPLLLTLDRVHTDRLSAVGAEKYFACADFKTPDGKLYDLDLFLAGADKGSLKVTEIAVHKEAGKERYTWYEEGGVWKKKPVIPAR